MGNHLENELATELTQRWNGPFNLRLLLQPTMALLFALRDGRRDAASGSDPYLQRIFFNASERSATIASAWAAIGKVLIIAFVLDMAFQLSSGEDVRVIQSVGMETVGRMRQRVLANLTTTFASSYKKQVDLDEMLTKEAVTDYRAMKTGEKYLVKPWK